ncbi:transporter [Akkermansiaceae bacterium]|nr:transporter [Akkermansiaceae bacterium]
MKFNTLSLSLSLVTSTFAGDFLSAPLPTQTRADSHAPIGVMGDHIHKKGGFMASCRYQFMRMEQNFLGTSAISDTAVQGLGYGIVPSDMDMQMHMVGLMYAPSDSVTLMAMVNFVEMSMNHRFGPGLPGQFKTKASGIGDSSITALIKLRETKTSKLHAGIGLLLPTAETEETDFIPQAGGVQRLPYPMQLGAGSWGLLPSLTYNFHQDTWSFGAQTKGTIMLNDNSEGYQLGDRFEATAWIAKPLGEQFSTSLRATFNKWGNISGSDALIMGPVPTTRTDLRGGSKFDLSLGVNFYETNSGVRAAAEIGKTLWQDLDGPQLGSDYWVTLGLQYAW